MMKQGVAWAYPFVGILCLLWLLAGCGSSGPNYDQELYIYRLKGVSLGSFSGPDADNVDLCNAVSQLMAERDYQLGLYRQVTPTSNSRLQVSSRDYINSTQPVAYSEDSVWYSGLLSNAATDRRPTMEPMNWRYRWGGDLAVNAGVATLTLGPLERVIRELDGYELELTGMFDTKAAEALVNELVPIRWRDARSAGTMDISWELSGIPAAIDSQYEEQEQRNAFSIQFVQQVCAISEFDGWEMSLL